MRYTPSLRGVGLDVMSSPEGRLVTGAVYRVASIEQGDYVSVEDYRHPAGGIYWSEFSFTLTLPAHLADKAALLGESSYGATRATLILTDGRRIHDVYLAWASEISKIGQRLISTPSELGFSMNDICDIQ